MLAGRICRTHDEIQRLDRKYMSGMSFMESREARHAWLVRDMYGRRLACGNVPAEGVAQREPDDETFALLSMSLQQSQQ